MILGLGIFLGVVGASLLLGFGIGYVKPYMDVKSMKSGHCVVALAENEEPLVKRAKVKGKTKEKVSVTKNEWKAKTD